MKGSDNVLAMLESMDVPAGRRTDFRWLLRNLAVRNASHPDFQAVMTRLKTLCRDAK